MKRTTALLIPAPQSGGGRYRAWYRLYRSVRQVRHLFGRHDWNPSRTCCTWCGKAWNS